jgi:hypothetical protein
MKLLANPTRTCILLTALLSSACLAALAQDTCGQTLGDVARKTRQEQSAPNHVSGKKLTDEDDGPDGGGVWRIRLCTLQPCYEFSITLPKSPKWSRAEQEPRPVLIPIAGYEEDPSRAIRVYKAQSTDLRYAADTFKRAFLQGWFARPEYFGRAAHITLDEHVRIDWVNGLITHFDVTAGTLKYRGVSTVAGSPYGNFGFACLYREEDSAAAASICDAIVHSAQYQELQSSFIRKTYKDPNDADPPEDDDP